MKKKVLFSSILTIALCLSLIAGTTYALFTSSDSVNVAVTAGTVKVDATIANISYTSTLGEVLPESTADFDPDTNEGTIQYIVPGDVIEFDMVVDNQSNVLVDYCPKLAVIADNGLWAGLVVEFSVDGNVLPYTIDANGNWTGAYQELTVGTDVTVHVSISLPEAAGNEYQNKTCTFAYTIEAIQGNAQ